MGIHKIVGYENRSNMFVDKILVMMLVTVRTGFWLEGGLSGGGCSTGILWDVTLA